MASHFQAMKHTLTAHCTFMAQVHLPYKFTDEVGSFSHHGLDNQIE